MGGEGLSNCKKNQFAKGGSVLVEGESLKVDGKGSGVLFMPVAENGLSIADETAWIKNEFVLVCNTPSKLLFAIPKEATAGAYRIAVRTRYAGKTGYERKHLVEVVSETVEIG